VNGQQSTIRPRFVLPDKSSALHVLGWDAIMAPLPELESICVPLHMTIGRPGVISGHPGGYKSWLAQGALVHAALDVPLLGRFSFRPGTRCLLIDYEQGEREARRRFGKLVRGTGSSGVGRLSYAYAPIPTWNPPQALRSGAESALCRLLENVDYCVVDSLIGCQPGTDENKAEASAPLTLAALVSEKVGCHIQLIDHVSPKGTSTMQRGHSSKLGASSVIMHTKYDKDSGLTECSTVRCQVAPAEEWCPTFSFTCKDSTDKTATYLEIGGETAPARAPDLMRQLVHEVTMCAGEGITGSALAKVLGTRKEQALALVNEALGNHLICRKGLRLYPNE
jgi:hypothetical protein